MSTPTNGLPEQQQSQQDLTKAPRIQTVVELVSAVGDEIEAIKAGTLEAKIGSLVLRGRGLQLRGVELTLQAARLDTKLRAGLSRRIGELPSAGIIKEVKAEPVPPLKIE